MYIEIENPVSLFYATDNFASVSLSFFFFSLYFYKEIKHQYELGTNI